MHPAAAKVLLINGLHLKAGSVIRVLIANLGRAATRAIPAVAQILLNLLDTGAVFGNSNENIS